MPTSTHPNLLSSLPPDYLARLQLLLGADFPSFASIYTRQPVSGLRVNSLKITPLDLCQRLGFQLQSPPWYPSGFILNGDPPLGKHPYHTAGLYYLQEPSAMAVAETLSPQPGERVLDISAAPGGKSTHLASLMQNQGWLVVNEIHPKRVWELAENLERWGSRNTTILNEAPERLADQFGALFDRVLVDAPCSGEGMFRKSEAARRDWSPNFVKGCAIRQGEIIRQAARLVRPGGRLAYSTCTFNPQENEAVIERFMDSLPENESWELICPPWQDGFSPGRPEWISSNRKELSRAVRIWPHLAPGEGHFVALLKKNAPGWNSGASSPRRSSLNLPLKGYWGKPDREALRLFSNFTRQTFHPGAFSIEPNQLALVGSYLYALPEMMTDLTGLKVIHPGWWLGILKKGRFEPSHALALGLLAAAAINTLDFSPDDPELLAYLRGETLTHPGSDGWLLVCVDGYPLGWGRRSQGTIKNYFPHGLRTHS